MNDAFNTALGSIYCDQYSWNKQWNPAIGKGEAQQVCSFHYGGREVDTIYAALKNYDPIIMPGLIYDGHFGSTEDMFSHVFCSRSRVARAICFFNLIERAEAKELHYYIGSLSADDLALYASTRNLQLSFPRLGQVLSSELSAWDSVYCLDDQQGHYKIGYSRDVNKRLTQLKTQPPFTIKILNSMKHPCAVQYEQALHKKYEELRLRGEWFSLPGDELEYLLFHMDSLSKFWPYAQDVYKSALENRLNSDYWQSLWDKSGIRHCEGLDACRLQRSDLFASYSLIYIEGWVAPSRLPFTAKPILGLEAATVSAEVVNA